MKKIFLFLIVFLLIISISNAYEQSTLCNYPPPGVEIDGQCFDCGVSDYICPDIILGIQSYCVQSGGPEDPDCAVLEKDCTYYGGQGCTSSVGAGETFINDNNWCFNLIYDYLCVKCNTGYIYNSNTRDCILVCSTTKCYNLNTDKIIDSSDFSIFASSYYGKATTDALAKADFNNDGKIDDLDSECLKQQIGTTTTCNTGILGGQCTKNTDCTSPLTCINFKCANKGTDNEPCDYNDNEDCLQTDFQRICTYEYKCRRSLDQPCTYDVDCASRYCDPITKKCKPNPTAICDLSSAQAIWVDSNFNTISTAKNGDKVILYVIDGSSCETKTITFTIKRDLELKADTILTTLTASFVEEEAGAIWNAVYENDAALRGYYFIAEVGTSSKESDPKLLTVTPAPITECRTGTDCGTGKICIEGTCETNCEGKLNGKRCSNNVNTYDSTNGGVCISGPSCYHGEVYYQEFEKKYYESCNGVTLAFDCDSNVLLPPTLGYIKEGLCCFDACMRDSSRTEWQTCCGVTTCKTGLGLTCDNGICKLRCTPGTTCTINNCPGVYDTTCNCIDIPDNCPIVTPTCTQSSCSPGCCLNNECRLEGTMNGNQACVRGAWQSYSPGECGKLTCNNGCMIEKDDSKCHNNDPNYICENKGTLQNPNFVCRDLCQDPRVNKCCLCYTTCLNEVHKAPDRAPVASSDCIPHTLFELTECAIR